MPFFESFDMTNEQKQALKACLLHWEENANLSPGKQREFGSKSCECCRKWLDTSDEDCAGCPVARFTGKSVCSGTPYKDRDIEQHSPIEKFREASRRERDFLRALLEGRFKDARELCEPYK